MLSPIVCRRSAGAKGPGCAFSNTLSMDATWRFLKVPAPPAAPTAAAGPAAGKQRTPKPRAVGQASGDVELQN
eukprot:6851951-Pyramimonas_sp.AAC.1